MNSQSPDPHRCQFTCSDGRRCQMSRAVNHSSLCLTHAKQAQEVTGADRDLSRELASLSGTFRTATDVNEVLKKLFSLVASGRIDRADAVALSYIAQLILQTLPGVKQETHQALGYKAWRPILLAALGYGDEDDEEEETEQDAETPDLEGGLAPAAAPDSLAELATMILTSYAKEHGVPPPQFSPSLAESTVTQNALATRAESAPPKSLDLNPV